MTEDAVLSGLAWAADKFADLGIGIISTLLGIFVVYFVARPRIEFADHVFASQNPNGSMRYGIRVRPRSRHLVLTEMRLSAYLLMGPDGRRTSVPVPLSSDTWLKVKRSQDHERWAAAPQLFLGEVNWRRHLTRNTPPSRPDRLESVMAEKDARLVVVVVSVSAIFGVTTVFRREYSLRSLKFLTAPSHSPAGGHQNCFRRLRRKLRLAWRISA